MSQQQYIVGPDTERMLDLGHPWVIADRFTKQWPKGQNGDLVHLYTGTGRLLATALLAPHERVVARVLGAGRIAFDSAWVADRIAAAGRLRDLIDLEGTTAYRLVNGEGDGLPGLTVDRYEDHLMVQLYSDCWRPHLGLVADALQRLLQPAGIYEKRRPQKTRELEAGAGGKRYGHLLRGAPRPGPTPVQENGLSYLVDLERGLDTGLFFDQRDNRRDLMGRAAGKTVLNLFAYTGAFSVAAAAAGATRVTSVDASAAILERAKENFALNRLNPKRHEFLAEDCFAALDRFGRENREFDIILFDPPSFSTTRTTTFSTRGGTADLVAGTLPLLRTGGLLIGSSNHQKTDLADYLKEVRRGVLQQGGELRVLSIRSQSADFPYPVTFPEGRYLKYVILAKASS